jgi:hypothetical protein
MRVENISRSKANKLTAVFVAAAMTIFGVVYSPETIASTTISQLGVDIDGEAAGDQSGVSVSLSSSGSRVAIGARKHDGSRGHVRIYDWDGTTWNQAGADIDGEAAGDESGNSVSLSADGIRVAIGARKNDGSFLDAGHVRIYDWNENANSWDKVGADIDGENPSDQSGSSVSLSADGSRLAIGARKNDGSFLDAGHVRIYDWNEGANSWDKVGDDIDGEAAGDESGNSVSLSEDGSRVAIGALYNDETGYQAGHVRIYDFDAGTWTQVGADIDGEAEMDNSGISVSLSSNGSRVAIGARYNDGSFPNAGHVRIYDLDDSTPPQWIQVGDDIDGEAVNDNSGSSVSLSADGTRVAIGANLNDGTGGNAGHVRIYDLGAGTWTKAGNDIDGEAAGDFNGSSVSLSADGTRVSSGATLNDGTATNAGHTRIFSLDSAALTPTFGTATKTADGLTVSITNYDATAAFTFGTPTVDNGSVTAATADGSNQLLTVTGLTPGQSVTITQTTTKASHFDGSATFTGFALTGAALAPTYGTATKTADGLTVSITNYDAAFTFGTPTVDNGSVTAATADGSNQLLTVTGLTNGQSVTITQTTTRTGYASGSATFTGAALLTGASIPVPSPYSGPLPTGVSSTEATAGDEVIISGKRLGGITSVRIDGLTVEISSQSAGSLTITIPLGLEPGLKNIRILSSDGNLTYQAALEIVALPTVEEPLPAAKPTEKLNAGSFQGLVAIYAKGYEGQKLSAKVAGKWLTVDSLGSGFERILRYTGAGYQIKIDLYINGILLQKMEVTTR